MGQTNIQIGPLDKASYNYYLKRDGSVKCHDPRCRQPIEVGDEVLRKKTNNYTRVYHIECARKLWII